MSYKYPKFTIIIPLYVIVPRFFKDLKKYEKLNYDNYEILIVSDKKINLDQKKVRCIVTNKKSTGPAEKRDMALKYVKSKYCAFIDDDAYPSRNWLLEALKSFKENPEIVAVGGPGLTPKEDNYWSKLGGLVYESILTSGKAQDRFVRVAKRKYVQDWPAYNLIVRADILKEVGGYGSSFYGGEDTLLCLKLIKYGKIVYNSKMWIYHHRRALFLPHLKQIYNVGIHRGYFAKRFPQTSRKFFYFIPSILTIGFFALLALSMISKCFSIVFIIGVLTSLFVGMISISNKTDAISSFLVSLGIILTHLTYGTGFIKGILTRELVK